MITKRNGNGQTECKGCKDKGKFALKWDSWLYNFNNEPYCFDCLMEELENLDSKNKDLKHTIKVNEKSRRKMQQSLMQQLKKKDEVIEDAIQFMKDNCIEQIPDLPKGCYRDIASIGDMEQLLQILEDKEVE